MCEKTLNNMIDECSNDFEKLKELTKQIENEKEKIFNNYEDLISSIVTTPDNESRLTWEAMAILCAQKSEQIRYLYKKIDEIELLLKPDTSLIRSSDPWFEYRQPEVLYNKIKTIISSIIKI